MIILTMTEQSIGTTVHSVHTMKPRSWEQAHEMGF